MSLTVFETAAPTPRSAIRRLLEVPHRLYFSAGVLAVLTLAAWWAVRLAAPAGGGYPAMLVHALLMPLGVFPLFMLGFIFTAGPRWLDVPAPGRHAPLALGYFSGLLLALAGFGRGGSWPAAGLLLMQLSWSLAALRWLQCIGRSRAADKRHALRLFYAMLAGSVALMLALLWVRSGEGMLWWQCRQLTLWGFLLPVFLIVCHRMIPFFTHSALPAIAPWRPAWLLDGWLLACAGLAVVGLAGVPQLEAALAFALAASLGWASWRWGLATSLGNRLLAMLHLSFAWLAPALLLQGLAALGLQVGAAPAHALGMGFCCTMLVGFVTRVSLGHSGRQLQADNVYWAIYLGLHAVALLRVAAALFGLPPAWLHLASVGWLLLMLAWACRVLPIYWRARVDGKPG
ncbi:NnrS family protein [Chitinimonas koreensis]|uniref:NnrS family protein n=1 Tax=Chitinimonas koreensis TaxID=356302 RepID=UPI00040FF059|nr:NnrS family protein [Chitinimonas koreensis]QNM95121.1 NnrS family protein [Chitinimonas koreensis]